MKNDNFLCSKASGVKTNEMLVAYLNGWQIAIYRSQVNEVIVRIVALVEVSDSNPCRIQMVSSNG